MGTLPYMSHEIDSFELLIHHSLPWTKCLHMLWHFGSFLWHFRWKCLEMGIIDSCLLAVIQQACEQFHLATDNLGEIPIRLDAQKHIDDLLHSAGNASPLLSGRGLSYNYSQRTHGRLLQSLVDSEQHYSKYRYRTHPLSNSSCRLTYIYASRIIPASSTKFHDNFTKVMGMVKKYKKDIGIIYMNQDLRCVLWCPRCQIYKHISGPSLWRWCWCLHFTFSPRPSPLWRYHGTRCQWQEQLEMHNISELARKIGPRVSDISLFAVLWFRIDQRLLKSTVVPISIPGISSSVYLPCAHRLWLYNTIHWEGREHAFLADDAWSGSSRCFNTSKGDGIAASFCPSQVENCTCTLYSRNDTSVNNAYLQTLLSKMQKRTQNVAACDEICSSLPTTMSGCDEQNSGESIMAHIWKYAHLHNITCWKPV